MIEGQENLPNLPDGWNWANFPELAANKANALKAGPFGSALKKSFYVPSGYKIYGQEQVIKGDPYYGDYYIDENKFNDLISCSVAPQDILISLVGTIGKVLILPDNIEPGIINPRLVKLSLDKRISLPEYIKLYVESETVRKYFSMVSHGGTMEILNLKILKALPIPTPPLNEQRRIVEKIEGLTARSRKAREALEAIPELLDQFRQSVLAAAFRGDLTADWREQNPDVEPAQNSLESLIEQNKNRKVRRGVPAKVVKPEIIENWTYPKTWTIASAAKLIRAGGIIDLKDGNHGGSHPKVSDFTEEGLPFITAAQVKDFQIDYEAAYKVSGEPLKKLRVGFAKEADVVFTHKGSVGRVAIADRECVLTPQTTYYRVNPSFIYNKYLMWFLVSPKFLPQTEAIKSQTTRDFIPITNQYTLFHLIPPLQEQLEIVRRLESLLNFLMAIEKQYLSSQQDLTKLDQSILAKAFRGKLVPQDPNDEPAAVLLERIRAERINSKGKIQNSKKRKQP